MKSRHILTLSALLAFTLGGCNLRHQNGEGGDSGPAPSADAGDGVCCPIHEGFPACGAGYDPGPAGGWAPSRAQCTARVDGFDVDWAREIDEHGCPVWVETGFCCGCVDAGMPPPPPPPCEGLDEVACDAAPGCVPAYHDACCSSCEPGLGCADCVDMEFWTCAPYENACEAAYCYTASPWGCGGGEPDCSDASPTGLGSCSVAGCTPAVAAEGFMEPVDACVPVTAESCTVACRALPPTCPPDTVAEGDGSCWTGRCIAASICAA